MLGKFAELFIFGFAPLFIGILAVPEFAVAEEKTLSGEVLYRERIALPPNAILTVQLADVSLADASATVIGSQTIDPAGQVPIKFAIDFDPAIIRTGMSYALQARITVDEQLWFINDVRHAIDPLTAGPQTMLLKMVRQENEQKAADIFDREWVAEDIGGAGVLDAPPSMMRIATDGKVTGRGACNNIFGTATVTDDTLSFSPFGSTFMACAEPVMAQEKAFVDALNRSATYRIEGGKLILSDKDGKETVRFGDGP